MASIPGPNGVNIQTVSLVDTAGNQFGTASVPLVTATANPLSTSGMTPLILNTAVSGDILLASGVTGQTTRLHRMRIYVRGATIIQIKAGTGTVLETIPFPAAGNFVLDFSTRPYHVLGGGVALYINNSSAVQIDGLIEFIRAVP